MGSLRIAVTATMTLVVTLLPVFVLAASGSVIRAELEFDAAQLGITIASAFAMTAIVATVGGRFCQWVGPSISMRAAAYTAAAALFTIAALVSTWEGLFIAVVLAGCANGLGQPAVSLALTHGVQRRQALMFGVQQSGVPLATMLSGAAVPLIALTVSWRLSFAIAGLIALLVGLTVPSLSPGGHVSGRAGSKAASLPVLVLALGTAFGSGAGTVLGSFLVESATVQGFGLAAAGWLLVAGSCAGIGARLLMGMVADRLGRGHLLLVGLMVGSGSLGFFLLAATAGRWFVVGALLAYILGFGWAGVLMYSIARLYPMAPAAATGVVHMGAAAGAAIGPLAFGIGAARHSFRLAWTGAGASAVLASMFVLLAHRLLSRKLSLANLHDL